MTRFPISVLHFSNSVVRGGAEEHMLTLLRALDRTSFRLHLVCTPECAETLEADLPRDVHLFRLSFQSPFNLVAAAHLARQLRRLQIDILHSHLFSASLAASPIGWMCGVPLIIETPHIREAWRRGLIKGHYFVDRFVGGVVDDYIAVSKANARYLIEEKGLPAKKVHVIHNGCDLTRYQPERPAPPDLKRSMGFAEEDPVLIVLGRLETQKGHRVLLEAFSRVVCEFPSARLVCVGEGSLRKQLQQQTEQLHLGKSVRFVGFQSNVPDWLAISEISVLPSLFEGLPLVAIESLAAERAMVATAVDGTAEVVIDEETGLTVPPGDVQRMTEAILRLLRQPELRRRMARAGRRWVLEHFSQQQQIRKTEELYLQAWGRNASVVKLNVTTQTKKEQRDCDRATQLEQGNHCFGRSMSGVQEFGRKSIDTTCAIVDAALLREAICESVRRNCEQFFGAQLAGIVLTGSVARDEGSFSYKEEFWELFSDAEFLLVFEKTGVSPEILSRIRQRIENDLRQRKIICTIDLSAVSESYFRHLPPHIFSYELKHCGQVICGEDRVLRLIPDFSVSDLLKEDAWRLLCNRMIEQFAFVEDLSGIASEITSRLYYATVKLYLDMATSYLVFASAYEATYRERAKKLRLLAAQTAPSSNVPFSLKDFSERVSDCTDWKLLGGTPSDLRREFWEEAIHFASDLWRWEVTQLTNAPSDSSASLLCDHLAQQLKFTDKLRGWASAVRRSGGLRSWYNWPRWAYLGLRATPRYLVYRVGAELFFRLPHLAQSPNRPLMAGLDLAKLKSFLPTPRSSSNVSQDDWQVLAGQVFSNYLQFVATTRA